MSGRYEQSPALFYGFARGDSVIHLSQTFDSNLFVGQRRDTDPPSVFEMVMVGARGGLVRGAQQLRNLNKLTRSEIHPATLDQ